MAYSNAEFVEMKNPSDTLGHVRESADKTMTNNLGLVTVPLSFEALHNLLFASVIMAGMVSLYFICRATRTRGAAGKAKHIRGSQ